MPLLWYSLLLILSSDHFCSLQPVDIFTATTIYSLQLLFNRIRELLICHITHNWDAMGSYAVTEGDRWKFFLACCVPYLNLDCFPIELYSSDFEIHSNCADTAFRMCILCRSKTEAELSNPRVANQK
jgi:hypothetical protein